MPRRAGPNMFEPAPTRRSTRIAGKATATRTEPQLLEHIASLTSLRELAVLKMQMDAERVPKTKAVKNALEHKEEEIIREQEENVVSPNNIKKKMRPIRKAMGQKTRKNTGMFFGTRKPGLARRAMNQARNAELEAALQALPEAQKANEANAAHAARRRGAPNAAMNNLSRRFGQMSLGPRMSSTNGLNPLNRNRTRKGVKGYHGNFNTEEGGGRRKRRS